jgi:LuxR family maltose regulon positive regulatory protein
MATRARFRPTFPVAEGRLHPPAPRAGTVSRPRLIRLLASEPAPPIVTLVAPPGFGKTVLLADWAAQAPCPVAWLTLERLDNDAATFLSYVVAAIDRVRPVDDAIRSALTASGERILTTAVPRLASELHRWDRPGVLVLDDVHLLEDRLCLDALTELLDHLPPGFRVFMAGRREPHLPLGRHRAHRDLLEIGRGTLAFDEEEAAALIAAVDGRLAPPESRQLVERTEGWAAGIYLAALARARGEAPRGGMDGVSGRDGYIAEYLRAELEAGLEDNDVALLTRTSILETIEPDAAAAVAGDPGAGTRLRVLATRFPLVQRLEGPDEAYRYHQLLREYLEGELERREPGGGARLHARAAAWFASAGRTDLAIDHLLAAGEPDAAAGMATAAAMPTFYGGRVRTLDRWLQALGEPVLARNPPLAVIAAWINILLGRTEAGVHMADLVEGSSWVGPPGDGAASFESSRAMLRAVMGRHGADDVLANAELAAAAERPDSPWRANALWLLGSARLLQGDRPGADAALAEAVAAGATSRGTAMVALAKRASLAMDRGDWQAADGHARASRAVLERSGFGDIAAALIVHAVSARVAAQLGDQAGARTALVQAQLVRPLASYAVPWFSVDALLELARAYLALSDPAGARSVIREAEDIVRRRPDIGVLRGELEEVRRRVSDASSTLVGSSTLTSAELRLLPILSTYLSFQEIADRLHVSRNTIKTQALSIYGKLQASSRSEAVERAVELGLLEPFPGLGLARSRRTD